MPLLRRFQSSPKRELEPQKYRRERRGSASPPRSHTSIDPWYGRDLTGAHCPATTPQIGELKQPFRGRTHWGGRRTSLEQTTGTSRNRNRERTSSVDLFRRDLCTSHCRRLRQSCTSLLWGCTHRFGLLFLRVHDPGNNAGPCFR